MRFSKMITAFKSMDALDRKRFGKYLHSPYFEIQPTATALFEYLCKVRNNFSAKDLAPSTIASNAPLLKTESIQNKASTLLLCKMKKYAAQEFHHRQPYEMQRDLLRGLKQRHWFEWFEEEYEAAINETVEEQRGVSLEYFEQQHYLAEIKHNGFDIKLNNDRYSTIAPVWQSLEVYYAIKKIRYYCEEMNRAGDTGKIEKADNEAYLLATLAPYCNQQYRYVWKFVVIYKMLSASEVADALIYYRQIKALVEQEKTSPLPAVVIEVAEYLRMFCIKQVNRGIVEMYPEYLWNITFQIRHGLFKAEQGIAPTTFTNLFNIAAKINYPPEGLLLFIDKLGPILPAAHRASRLHFAKGIYHFSLKQYKDAAYHFAQVDVKKDALFNALCRRWYFMSRFEAHPYEHGLDTVLKAFERYVQRHHDIPPFAQVVFQQFTYYAQKLLINSLKKEKRELKTQLESEKYFAGKEWLMEKLSI